MQYVCEGRSICEGISKEAAAATIETRLMLRQAEDELVEINWHSEYSSQTDNFPRNLEHPLEDASSFCLPG